MKVKLGCIVEVTDEKFKLHNQRGFVSQQMEFEGQTVFKVEWIGFVPPVSNTPVFWSSNSMKVICEPTPKKKSRSKTTKSKKPE